MNVATLEISPLQLQSAQNASSNLDSPAHVSLPLNTLRILSKGALQMHECMEEICWLKANVAAGKPLRKADRSRLNLLIAAVEKRRAFFAACPTA